jgi:hypothetical protein
MWVIERKKVPHLDYALHNLDVDDPALDTMELYGNSITTIAEWKNPYVWVETFGDCAAFVRMADRDGKEVSVAHHIYPMNINPAVLNEEVEAFADSVDYFIFSSQLFFFGTRPALNEYIATLNKDKP